MSRQPFGPTQRGRSNKRIVSYKRIRLYLTVLFIAFLSVRSTTASAQTSEAPRPTRPPVPTKYFTTFRYRITSSRDQHVAQFDKMVRALKGVGFQFEPPLSDLPNTIREDQAIDTLTGYISGEKALQLLQIPRIASVRLRPADFPLPGDPAKRVMVELDLAWGFAPEQQREFLDQMRALLDVFRFNESIGYDHRGITGQPFTRIRGTIPVGLLDTILKDVRRQPTNWFSPVIAFETLPSLLRSTNPIPLIKVLKDSDPPEPLPFFRPRGATPKNPAGLPDFSKIDDRLWNNITGPLWAKRLTDLKPLRIELIMTVPPTGTNWRNVLEETAPRLVIEGQVGNLVTATFGEIREESGKFIAPRLRGAPEQIKALSTLEMVSTIRLPESPANGTVSSVEYGANNEKVLVKSGLKAFHAKGHTGKGIRIAILDTDFRNYEKLIAENKLPKSTILVDLTTERNRTVQPEPYLGRPDVTGHGTQCAFAAALAAPEAEILLVRLAHDDPTMLKTFFDYAAGRTLMSEYLSRQSSTFEQEANSLQLRAQALKVEKKVALETFKDEEELKKRYYYLGRIRPWVLTPREWYFHRQNVYDRDEAIYKKKVASFYRQLESVKQLRNLDIISSSLVWNDAYALARGSAITELIDQNVRRVILPKDLRNCNKRAGRLLATDADSNGDDSRPLWFQSVGNAAGQTWNGRFLDFDKNGVMEFRDPEDTPQESKNPLPKGSWTRELNFIQWKQFTKQATSQLPGDKTRYRVSLQWNEPHAADYFFRSGENDFYRFPLAGLRVVVLRQRDPSGKIFPSDDFEVVARSDASPTPYDYYSSSPSWVQRLNYRRSSATYSLRAEWVADKDDRYAVRIERQLPTKWLIDFGNNARTLRYNKITNLVPTGLLPVIIKDVPGHGPKVVTPTLPKIERQWELNVRLHVRAIDGPHAKKGRPIWQHYSTPLGTIGVPGDGQGSIPVGAVDLEGKPQDYSSPGPPVGMDLVKSPRVFGFDSIGIDGKGTGPAFGSNMATPFVAGMAASILSSGQNKQELYQKLKGRP
ncbi:MAG: S8/S53 family peptidase [Gemmataceae bacterium]